MDWKKIDQSWKQFASVHGMELIQGGKDYGLGNHDIYQTKEEWSGEEVYYENRFYKSASYGSSFRIGHRMTVLTPLNNFKQKNGFLIKRNSLFKRVLFGASTIKIIGFNEPIKNKLPSNKFKEAYKLFPDLRISYKLYDKYNHSLVVKGQPVLESFSKNQPKNLEYLNIIRNTHLFVLEVINEHWYE